MNTKSIQKPQWVLFLWCPLRLYKNTKLKTVNGWKQKSCISCHFLIANNTKLHHTFPLYFFHISKINLIKLWFYAQCFSFTFSTASTTQRLFLYMGESSYTGFTHYLLLLSYPHQHLHPHPSTPHMQDQNSYNQESKYLRVLGICQHLPEFSFFTGLFPWKEIFPS